ncbi:thiolase-like protein [Xylaria grammica]|nr:thiolase-like protein [Xylaria grammica]
MPSASDQQSLIRETYRRAGLDCRLKSERCQYLEAHGTGTPTGGPIEAEAIRNAFFPDAGSEESIDLSGQKEKLLAGLLKASLAVQHGIIPPNMHLDTLSPAVEPFYTHLEVPVKA